MPGSLVKDLEAYFLHLQVRNYSPETITHQRSRAKKVLAFLAVQGVKGLGRVTPKHVKGFQIFLYEWRGKTGKPLHVSTQNNNLAMLKTLLHWAHLEGKLSADPSKGVAYAKQPRRLPRTILTTTEMRRILNAPQVDSLLGYRDKAFLELLYATMARRGEIRRLRLTDLDFEAGTVRINLGKGAKDRTVPMGKLAGRYLKHYLEKVRPHLLQGHDDGYLFLSKHGKQMCSDTVAYIVKRHAKGAGLAKHVHAHAFRASGLTHMLRNGANVRHLMDLAGHASMDSLNSYLAVEISDLKATHARCHPREIEGER